MGEGREGAHRARRDAIRRKIERCHERFYHARAHWPFAKRDGDVEQPLRWRREHWVITGTVAVVALLAAIGIPSWANAMKHAGTVPQTVMALTLPALPPPIAEPKTIPWHKVEVQPKQTLSGIFQSLGFGFDEVHLALDATSKSNMLHHMHPGDVLLFRIDQQGKLKALRFDANDKQRVTLHFAGGKVTKAVEQRSFSLRQHVAHGVIQHSLSESAAKAGLSNAVMVKLAHVFRHEINFRRDIRSGDRFTVIYNAVYRDGSYLHAGNVLAAEFRNRGHLYTAYRFTLPNGHVGYYTLQGRPLSVSLLRTPVKYTRVSSPFGWRIDPVLHSRHLHTGVDLAAPMGTPIHAASRGVITVHRWVHGYGRYICIKLNSTYSTCYAHMSKYAKGLHDGTHVHQGEVIGYVGMTGYATGPHLHFEVHVHGKPVNPLTVTMPKPKPLKPQLLAQFKQQVAPLLARIQRIDQRYEVATADTDAQPGHTIHAG